jgi:transcriptional regulator with XRE-family HTH domain
MGEFGLTLREKRRTSGLSQRRLAERVGLDFSYISKLENGRLPAPASDTIWRIAQALGCPSEELFAAAQRLPQDVSTNLADEPAALRFLAEASRLRPTPSEWDELRGVLRHMRGGGELGEE